MSNIFSSFVDIIPALSGITISGIFLMNTAFDQLNKNPLKIQILTFLVISSGFLSQKFYSFFFENKLAITLISIFVANYMLKELANRKEKQEISIIFLNSIESQRKALAFIQLHFNLANFDRDIEYIKIYKNRLDNDELYHKALKKIGIYNQVEIDIISQYPIMLNECLSYIDRLFININILIKDNKNPNDIQQQNIYLIARLSVIQSIQYGLLAIYLLKIQYSQEDKQNLKNNFIQNYLRMIKEIKCDIFKGQESLIIHKNLSHSICSQFKYLKHKFDLINQNILRINIKNEIYEVHYIAIMTTSQNTDILTQDQSIIGIASSEKEAINNCQNFFNQECKNISYQDYDDNKINNLIQQCTFQTELISLS